MVREKREPLEFRLRCLMRAVGVLIGLVAVAYWDVQVVRGRDFRRLAENNRLRELSLWAPRGRILDRQGSTLAENVPSYSLLFDLSSSPDLGASLEFAARVLQRRVADLEAVLRNGDGASALAPRMIAEGLTLGQVARIELAALEHPEFQIRVDPLRLYRHGEQTAHLLGYLREVRPDELQGSAGSYIAGDLVGRSGIEYQYDALLRGRNGRRVVVVDSRGRVVEEFRSTPASPGRDLTLTIDLDLQQEAEHLLENLVGAVVVMDPKNGEILALASAPPYDPNVFSRRLDRRQWSGLLEAPHQPLQNRTIQNTYAPGSVFKIVVALAALQEEVVSPGERVVCRGWARLYDRRHRCWNPSGHGAVDLHDALKYSCDVYFYHLGVRLGISHISRCARLLGFGSPTEIDLRGEKRGLVPDPGWSLRVRKTPWYPGETVSVAVGQGPLLATPLQMARLMAIVATRGYCPTPHLRRESAVPQAERVEVAPEALELVRRALWSVVNEGGTGATARLPGRGIAGKTGTVQVVAQQTWTDSSELPPEQRDHAWFASFAPLEDPEIVVVVFVEHGGRGSHAAAPIAKVLYERYFEKRLDSHPRRPL